MNARSLFECLKTSFPASAGDTSTLLNLGDRRVDGVRTGYDKHRRQRPMPRHGGRAHRGADGSRSTQIGRDGWVCRDGRHIDS